MCCERVTTTWSASPSAAPPAVVADHRDRLHPPPARFRQRLSHCRVPARGERQHGIALAAVGDHLAREDRLVPMSLASAVRIAGSSVRSSARRGGQPGGGGRGSRRPRPWRRWPSRRCRARAARRPRRAARRPAAAATSASRPSSSVCSRSSPTSPAFISTDRRTSARTASRSVSRSPRNGYRKLDAPRRGPAARAPRAGPGARRTRARAPTARGRASRRAPGARTGRRSAARTPTPRRLGSNAMVRQPRSRASASARRLGVAEGDHDVLGLGDERRPAPQRPALGGSPIAGSARLPTITGCTNSTATWRTSERRRGEARAPPAPAAREALGHRVAQPRDRSASAAKKRSLASVRHASSSVDAPVAPRRPHAGTPPARGAARRASRGTPSTPSPVRALTSMCGTPGCTASRL